MKIDYEKVYPLAYRYNQLNKRFDKALRYFDDNTIDYEKKLKQEENFRNVIKEMGELNQQIIALGHKITDAEAFEGYDLIEISKKIDSSKYGDQVEIK